MKIYENNLEIKYDCSTFIKTKFKITDDRRILTSIDQLQILQNIIFIKINLTKNHYSKTYDDKAIISCEKISVERKKWLKLVHKQGNWALVVQTDI